MDDDYAVMVVDVFGTTYKIWADGKTEGFGPGAAVFNRIPRMIADARRQVISDDERDPHHGCV